MLKEQAYRQWCAELNGWREAVLMQESYRPDEVIFMALGGLRDADYQTLQREVFADAVKDLVIDGVKLSLVLVTWKSLDAALISDRQYSPREARLMADMSQALFLAGHHFFREPHQLETLVDQRRVGRNATTLLMS